MCLLVRRGKPACCLRMKVLHGEGLATHSNGCPQVRPSLNKRKNLCPSASKNRFEPKNRNHEGMAMHAEILFWVGPDHLASSRVAAILTAARDGIMMPLCGLP